MNRPDPITRLNAALEGRYHIESELGEGGMATVYLADDLKHERKVALKVLKPELAAVVGAERFLAEIKTTANLQHPHILPLFDSGEADSFLFYVMPYVEGETLRDRLEREKQLPVEEAVRIATDVAEALHSAHEQGVIHRDIKPANILMSKGRPLVADFGIALAVAQAGGGRLTETGLSMGTPYYMSPEQASADRDPSAASDVYSLGCVLYEMLVGDPPYVGGSAQAVLAKILTADAPAPTEARTSIPANVDATIRKALEKLPADRFISAGDLARALSDSRFRHGGAAEVGEDRRIWSPLAAAAAAVALLTGLALGLSLNRGVETGGEVSRLSAPVPTGVLMEETNTVDISRDGRTLAYVTDGRLVVRSLGSFDAVPVAEPSDVYSPFFSPDGRWVGFSTNAGIKKIELTSGTIVDVVYGTVNYGASWDETEGIVYTPALGQTGLWRVPADGGEPQPLTTVRDSALEMAHVWPQVLPDGRGILFTVLGPSGGWNDGRLAVIEWGSDEHRIILEQETYGRYVTTGHLLSTTAAGAVMAREFDLRRLEPVGSAVPVLDDVRVGSFGAGASLAISETGTVAFATGSSLTSSLMLEVARTGEIRRQLTDPLSSGWLRLSPSGDHLAFARRTPNNDDIWVLDLSSGLETRFTTAPDEDESPVWSPDGEQIIYSGAYTGLARRVFARPADGTGEPQELFRSDRHLHLEDWSPDGEWVLASQIDPITDLDLLVIRVDSPSERDTLASGPLPESSGRFSNDGRWVIYDAESQETGRSELWAVPFPALTNHRQITNGGGSRPRFAGDDSELFYVRGDSLVVSNVEWEGGPRLSAPTALFALPGLWPTVEVAPDGQTFFILTPNPDAPAREIRIITNWFTELRERMGGN